MRIPYICTSCPICARCNISTLHVGSCNHCCSRDKTSRTERLNSAWEQELENGEEREALLPRRRLIIDVLRDTAANGEPVPAQCIKDRVISS